MRDGRIEEILEVLLSPPDNVPSRAQQLPTHTVNGVSEALLPPPEVPNGLPEPLRSQLVVLLHGLTELLPDPSFCLCHSPGLGSLGLTVPFSRLRSPTSQQQPIGLLLRLDSVPYCRCPPPGSGIAAASGTADLMAAATGSSIDNRCGEHGPFGLCLQHPPESGQSSPGGGSSCPRALPDFPSRPSLCAWACQVCPAFSSSSSPNSPPPESLTSVFMFRGFPHTYSLSG
ncbi:hypothetical protein CRENBAI_001021 [Crenichthys baileyi]|uniref:Uncharacterized protein n=1 Tax=Crenichthys baileyi TaxID=28760 RepID=A0AAV9REE4_9TELE